MLISNSGSGGQKDQICLLTQVPATFSTFDSNQNQKSQNNNVVVNSESDCLSQENNKIRIKQIDAS